MSRTTLALAVAVAVLATSAHAQIVVPSAGEPGAQNIEGITVSGKGTVEARPNRLEIDLGVSSASELTADAIVKYRDAKNRIEESFRNLKIEDVQVEEQGLLVDRKGNMPNPYYYEYQPNQRTKTEVEISRKLVVKCAKIRDLDEEALLQLVAKLLDVAQDAGGQVGSQPMYNPYYYYNANVSGGGLVRFILDDFDALEEQAYEAAVADARARAQRLAKLSGVELGPIVAVREVIVPGEETSTPINGLGMAASSEGPARKRLESSKFEEISIRVELLVRFEIHPRPQGEAKAGGQ